MFAFDALPPLALYVHWPWCVRKCPYCDFNSHAASASLPENEYVAALLRDLEHDLPRVWGRRVRSIFIGGGTPSLMRPESVESLLAGIRARIPLAPEAEISLEANPGATDTARLRGYREAGVNRLSIGVQSFHAGHLARLGRIHGPADALRAADAARAAGFDNFNLDLMYGLPEQSPAEAEHDVRTALALAPAHLSAYQLTIEPNTAFANQPPALPDDEVLAEIETAVHAQLHARGFRQYEVSAWAWPGRECAHNLNYWQFGDYLGIGAGAHAKITDATGITRLIKPRHPAAFMRDAGAPAGILDERRLTPADAAFEFMLNALRLTAGVPMSRFRERAGLAEAKIAPLLDTARRRGLISHDSETLRATAHGQRYLNDLTALFLPDAA